MPRGQRAQGRLRPPGGPAARGAGRLKTYILCIYIYIYTHTYIYIYMYT